MAAESIVIRRAVDADLSSILDVCASSLGWLDPEWDEALFRWKHLDNAFGRSLLLVAEDETGLVAVRAMLRWRFSTPLGTVTAVRPVDTATKPCAQGKGLFRRLTMQAIEELTEENVGFAFNTPNAKSRPGYLKMGWQEAGRVPITIRVRSPRTVPRTLRARTAADKRSVDTPRLGVAAEDYFSRAAALPATAPNRVTTDHDRTTLAWRFVGGPVKYRVVQAGDGAVVVRVRQRGRATELVVACQLGDIAEKEFRSAIRKSLDVSEADHLVMASRNTSVLRSVLGPRLTLRPLASRVPEPNDIAWSVGDIELF